MTKTAAALSIAGGKESPRLLLADVYFKRGESIWQSGAVASLNAAPGLPVVLWLLDEIERY